MKKKNIYLSILVVATVALVFLAIINNHFRMDKHSSSSHPIDNLTDDLYGKYTNVTNPYYGSLSDKQKQKIIKLSPTKIIELYESTNDRKIALALLHPYLLIKLKNETDLQNHRKIATCKDVTKERNQKMGLPSLPEGVYEFEVSYVAKKWPDLVFFTLVKDSHDGHWKIVGIDTSP